MSDFPPVVPQLLHTVLDAVDVRAEADFWRELLGLAYRPGDEVPASGRDDADWLVLTHPDGRRCLAIQGVDSLPPSRWPEPGHPSVSHLDTTAPWTPCTSGCSGSAPSCASTAPTTPTSRSARTPARRVTSSASSWIDLRSIQLARPAGPSRLVRIMWIQD